MMNESSPNRVASDIASLDIVYGLDVSPNFRQDRRCFAAKQSGLYRSHDGGLTWEGAYSTLDLEAPLPTAAVSLSPAFERDETLFAGVHGAVLRSTDGAETWSVAQLPSPPPFVISIVVSPDFERDGVVLVATMEDGVFRSADRGNHWSAWNFGLLDLNALCLVASPDYARDETLLVGTETGVFKSTNVGRAWREANVPPEWGPILSLALSTTFADDGVVYGGTETCGLMRSRDCGGTWKRLEHQSIPRTVNGVLLSGSREETAAVLVLGPERVVVSTDGGRGWRPVDVDLADGVHLTAAAAPTGRHADAHLLLGADDGSIVRSSISLPAGG